MSQPGCAHQGRRLLLNRPREFLVNPAQALLQWGSQSYRSLDLAIEAELARRRKLMRLLQKWQQKLESLVRHKGHWEEHEEFLKDYADEFLWCPFLKDSLCEMCPVRPLSCRCHFATSPPEKCGGEEPVVEIDPAGSRLVGMQALATLSTYLTNVFGVKGLPDTATFPKLVALWLNQLERRALVPVNR